MSRASAKRRCVSTMRYFQRLWVTTGQQGVRDAEGKPVGPHTPAEIARRRTESSKHHSMFCYSDDAWYWYCYGACPCRICSKDPVLAQEQYEATKALRQRLRERCG